MNPAESDAADALAFGEKMLALLDQGRFTATYKYAVVLGLLDACRERTAADGAAPDHITTAHLAEKVTALYWPHTLPYRARRRARVLYQSAPRAKGRPSQAEIVARIERFRAQLADPSVSLFRARQVDPAGFARMLAFVEWKLVEMPLPRLQRFGETPEPFIYRIGWNDDVTAGQLRQPSFDRRIRFVGAAGEHLLQLGGLLRPLLHREWARMVAALNDDLVDAHRLERFLFGVERVSLEPVRAGLIDLQQGRCFYCRSRLPRGEGSDVDHFLPWSRTANDCLENLVVADARCNADKRDFLAAAEPLVRWRDRLHGAAHRLQAIGADVTWPLDPERTLSEARALYLRVRTGGRLWGGRDQFIDADPRELRAVLAAPSARTAEFGSDGPPGVITRADVRPFVNAIPAYPDLFVAAGRFSDEQLAEEVPGLGDAYDPAAIQWVAPPAGHRPARDLFVARVTGESMNRVVQHGQWALFRLHPKGTREGKVVLVRQQAFVDPDGGQFTLKRYRSLKAPEGEDAFRHVRIELHPDSSDPRFAPIVLEAASEDEFAVIAELLAPLSA
jgi:hypothetical protein